jgi:4-hydroxy-2-oxoheptanedioate aldolase
MNDPFDRSFRDRTLAGEALFGLFLDLGTAASAELCGAAGYDWLLVDLEHGPSRASGSGSVGHWTWAPAGSWCRGSTVRTRRGKP